MELRAKKRKLVLTAKPRAVTLTARKRKLKYTRGIMTQTCGLLWAFGFQQPDENQRFSTILLQPNAMEDFDD